jgi:hypothetical protein
MCIFHLLLESLNYQLWFGRYTYYNLMFLRSLGLGTVLNKSCSRLLKLSNSVLHASVGSLKLEL